MRVAIDDNWSVYQKGEKVYASRKKPIGKDIERPDWCKLIDMDAKRLKR